MMVGSISRVEVTQTEMKVAGRAYPPGQQPSATRAAPQAGSLGTCHLQRIAKGFQVDCEQDVFRI
jgi:hypothetical protein